MSTAKKASLSFWPQLFTKRRIFSRQAENQPYIGFFQTPKFDGQEYEEDEDEDGDGEQEEGDDENEIEEDGENDAMEEAVSSGQGSRGEGCQGDRGGKDQDPIDDGSARSSNGSGNVRLFMTAFLGEDGEDGDLHRDQVEEVASMCEQWTHEKGVVTLADEHGNGVALLDDRNIPDNILTNKGDSDISPSGECRSYLGPLTAELLGTELKRKAC